MDIFSIGIGADSSQVVKAVGDLDKLTASAGRAEVATENLGATSATTAARQAAAAQRSELSGLPAQCYEAAVAATKQAVILMLAEAVAKLCTSALLAVPTK